MTNPTSSDTSSRSMSLLFWVGLFVGITISGCATDTTRFDLDLDASTVRLEGWLSARGEWMLFPIQDFETYDPYTKEPAEQCVSLVNDTGMDSDAFARLHSKQVSVTGFAMKYANLDDGTTTADKLLAKKYLKSERVENFCLRDLVFVVTKMKSLSE